MEKIIFHSINMQKLGQHFLQNAAVLQKIVDALILADGDRIIEIGPGHGELTVPLLQAAHNKRCEIFCIEKDHALIEGMKRLASQENSADTGHINRVNIVEGDVLKLLTSLTSRDYKIVGNIPYYITGKLLRTISELEYKPKRVVLLIQKEVAERICAAPPAMNRLAASVQFWADTTMLATVPRKDFSPPPEVDSAVIVLDKKNSSPELLAQSIKDEPSLDPAQYYRAVRAIFAQPRKTLLNNLSEISGGIATKNQLSAELESINIDPHVRPQNLSIAQIVSIAKSPLWG